MKNVRFYLEYPSEADKNKATKKDLGNHSGNVIAIFTHIFTGNVYRCYKASTYLPNSIVMYDYVSPYFLEAKCKLISEKVARKIHPELFNRVV